MCSSASRRERRAYLQKNSDPIGTEVQIELAKLSGFAREEDVLCPLSVNQCEYSGSCDGDPCLRQELADRLV